MMKSRTTTLLYLNCKNLNDRIYNTESANKILKDYKEKIKKCEFFYGCLEEDVYELSISRTVNLKLISHIVEDMWIKNNKLCAKIKILNTPKGKLLNDIFDICHFTTSCKGFVDKSGFANVDELYTVYPVSFENFAYKHIILREKKLKRILK